jgi:hypothetical protein
MQIRLTNSLLPAAAMCAALLLNGCAGDVASVPVPVAGAAFYGKVFGGQQPVKNAAITLYVAGTSGYGATNSNILTKTVATDGGGNFNISGDYPCTAGQQMYIVATKGDPGGGVNNNLALMAALGDCAKLSSSTILQINEVTTVGSAFALAPFMSSITQVSSSANNATGLAHAFASVNKLVNIATGSSPGPALPAGATAPASEIYTLANIIAICVNSLGGVANDNSNCGPLFGLTTPAGGTAPTDTVQAALNIAHNPALNAAKLFQTLSGQGQFSGGLTSAPNDWTLAVVYSGGGFSAPKSTTIDAQGNVWVANSGGNSVSVLAQSGVPLANTPLTGNGLAQPSAVAMDAAGNAWVANSGGTTVSAFPSTSAGGVFSGSPFSGSGTIAAPSAIAVDATGNIWVANHSNSSVTELSATGALVQQVKTGVSSPVALAVDPY